MAVYRNAKKEEYNDFIDLANYVFKLDFEQLLPKAFKPEYNTENITKVAENDGKLIAEVCVLPQTVNAGEYTLNSNYLGTVCVHPRYRGEGHMKTLMNLCIDEMQGKYDLSVLGGRRQRYEYFGYTYGGVQWEYTINIHNIRHALANISADSISIELLAEVAGGMDYAFEMNEKRTVHVYREKEKMYDVLTSYNHTPYAVMIDGKIGGYIIKSNGSNDISEFVLTDYNNTKAVIKAYFEKFEAQKIELALPEYETALHSQLISFAECYRTIPCCMFNIFDFAKVIGAFLTLKNDTIQLSHGRFSAIMDGQPVTITVNENGVKVENTATNGAVVLDKLQAQSLLLTPSGKFGNIAVPNDWFPLSLFWYYVDCF